MAKKFKMSKSIPVFVDGKFFEMIQDCGSSEFHYPIIDGSVIICKHHTIAYKNRSGHIKRIKIYIGETEKI